MISVWSTSKSARLKIKRANEHIADIYEQIAALCSPELQSITHEINPQTGDEFVHYDFKHLLVFDDLALAIGDAIHNLKTAADHGWFTLMSAFARSAINNFTRLPVIETRQTLEDKLRGIKVDTLSPLFFDFVVSELCPYRKGGNRLLCAIHDLDVRDKHKLLIPLTRVTAVVDAVLENEAGETTRGVSWGTINEALPITIPIPLKSRMKIKGYGRLAFNVVFDQGSSVDFLPITDTLEQFSKVVLGTIEAMEGFFARSK